MACFFYARQHSPNIFQEFFPLSSLEVVISNYAALEEEAGALRRQLGFLIRT
jgi:hypothetical protein